MKRFQFNGGAGTFLGTGILSTLIVLCTCGFGTPFAIVLWMRWVTKHTTIDGRGLRFYGSASDLLGRSIVWTLLTVITLGVYGFWVFPRYVRWCVENTDFAAAS